MNSYLLVTAAVWLYGLGVQLFIARPANLVAIALCFAMALWSVALLV
jgi:hypothetical protein